MTTPTQLTAGRFMEKYGIFDNAYVLSEQINKTDGHKWTLTLFEGHQGSARRITAHR